MHAVLAARSDFSIGESILDVERLIGCAKKVGATSIALTDTMSVTGLIDFSGRCKKADIKPIIGCRLRLVDDPTWRKTKESKKAPPEFFITMYVLSEKGLVALFRLLSLANSEERFYNVAKLGFADLFDALDTVTEDDVSIATSDAQSVIHHRDAASLLARMKASLCASNVMCQLTPIDTPYYDALNKRAIELAQALDLPTFVARPVWYGVDEDTGKSEAAAAEIMHAVTRNTKIEEMWAHKPKFSDLYPLTLDDLKAQCRGSIQRLEQRFGMTTAKMAFALGLQMTDRFVNRVEYVWSKAPVSLPIMSDDEFRDVVLECKKGWAERFAAPIFGHQPTQQELLDTYRPRLSYELGVLKSLGFSGYFLLVQDVVKFAKSSNILVGPGRGSVGGSLVAYLMGITDCDPLRFGLLFERFINPDRIDLPDADLDFMSSRRHEVIEYLVGKYGEARVAGISNFGTLGPSSAIRDVSKAFGLTEDLYRCSKMVPKEHGQSVPLKDAAEQVTEIGQFRDRFEPIWKTVLKLEGVMRNLGRHAAGVVVGGCDLVERAVIERRKDGATVNWDKRIVEEQGLVKMDILGLSTLDLISKALAYIRKRRSVKVDLMRIPLDDQDVLASFAKGLSTGVFQFESGGMRRLLKDLGQDGCITFDDITAATALYRPGPMDSGMMESYVRRKQGLEDVEYDHPLLEPVLSPTFGVFVYQEQVMRASQVLAGYTGAEADKLRKIMGKKLPEEMEKERDKFVDGCVRLGTFEKAVANDLFDKIATFAGYGFNKSHSVEYTLISYQSMWLKTHFPVEFIAAALSLMDQDKLPLILKDAKRLGVEISLPDINQSTDQFEILTDTLLSIPFNRVKGISDNTTNAILEARKTGPFISKEDLVARVERRKCNVRHVETLELVGAFASVVPGSLPARHPDRIKDQKELIPGLITDTVPVHRDMNRDKDTKSALTDLINEYRTALAADGVAVKPAMGRDAKIMIVMDCPSTSEEREGRMASGDSFAWQMTARALGEAGLSIKDIYMTALIKRPKEGSRISPQELTDHLPYFTREVEILKPTVIVLLGSNVTRHFFPDTKGKASEQAGKIVYSEELDANVITGFSPGEIYFDESKFGTLVEVLDHAAALIH